MGGGGVTLSVACEPLVETRMPVPVPPGIFTRILSLISNNRFGYFFTPYYGFGFEKNSAKGG